MATFGLAPYLLELLMEKVKDDVLFYFLMNL